MTAIGAVVLVFAMLAMALAVAGAIYALQRADRAVTAAGEAVSAADTAKLAAEAAQRHCDGLIELLAELSPSARRVWLASREHGSPAVALARTKLARLHGLRIDEGTT